MGYLFGSSKVGLTVTSSRRAYSTVCVIQVCCSQSPCSHGRPLLTVPPQETFKQLRGSSGPVSVGSLGPGVHKVLFEPFKWLWQVWGLNPNFILPPYHLSGASLLCPWTWGVFFWWNPTFSCQWLFSSELQFWSSHRRRCVHFLLLLHLLLSSNTFATWCEELTHWKRPWCWERLKAGGEGDDRGWDGWMASTIHWTGVWASSGSWWWTGKPGILQSVGSQRVGHDWATELICTSFYCVCVCHSWHSICFETVELGYISGFVTAIILPRSEVSCNFLLFSFPPEAVLPIKCSYL